MANIRKAEIADVPALLVMCASMHQESPRYRRMAFSEQKVSGLVEQLIAGRLPGGVLVAEAGGQLVGVLAFVVTEHFFTTDKIAADLGVYVKPEHRGTPAFARLVRAFEQAAGEQGVVEKTLGVSTGIHTEQTAGALERLGYERCSVGLRKANV